MLWHFFLQDTTAGSLYLTHTYHGPAPRITPFEFARMELVLENVLAKDTRSVTYPSVTSLPESTPMTLMVNCGSAESSVNRLGFCVNTALRTAPIG